MKCSKCKKYSVHSLLYRAGIRKCYSCSHKEAVKAFNDPNPIWLKLKESKNKKKG